MDAFGRIGAIVSDPPYGIGFQHGGGGTSGNLQNPLFAIKNLEKIHGDDQQFDPTPWIDAAPTEGRVTARKTETRIILFGADNYMQHLPPGGTLLAWDKNLGRGGNDSFADCEWAWCGRKVKREVFRYLWKGVVCTKSPMDMPPPSVKGGKHVGCSIIRPRPRQSKTRRTDALVHRQGASLRRPAHPRPLHGQRHHGHCCPELGSQLYRMRD